jgi:hypothetical protein
LFLGLQDFSGRLVVVPEFEGLRIVAGIGVDPLMPVRTFTGITRQDRAVAVGVLESGGQLAGTVAEAWL